MKIPCRKGGEILKVIPIKEGIREAPEESSETGMSPNLLFSTMGDFYSNDLYGIPRDAPYRKLIRRER